MHPIEIELTDVTLAPADEAPDVLEKVSFRVEAGEVLVIMGMSGSGKSTLLRALAGLSDCFDGQINWRRPSSSAGHQMLHDLHGTAAFMFQDPMKGLFPWKTVGRNLALPARLGRTRHRVVTCGDLKFDAGFEHHYPSQLSGGQQKRLHFGTVLNCQPSLLFLDEPFSGLDLDLALHMQTLLLRQAQRCPCTVIAVTHSALEAAIIGTDVAFVHERRLLRLSEHALIPDRQLFSGSPISWIRQAVVVRRQNAIQQFFSELIAPTTHSPLYLPQ